MNERVAVLDAEAPEYGARELDSLQVERALLAALLGGEEDWPAVVDELAENDFSRAAHGKIYGALKEMLLRGDKPDPTLLEAELEKRDLFEQVGGREMVLQLAESAAGYNAPAYARLVRDASLRRQLRQCGGQIARLAERPEGRDADDLLSDAQSRLFALGQDQGAAGQRMLSMQEALQGACERLERVWADEHLGIPSGFADLDRIIYGFNKGDLIILAARPSVGKTAFSLDLARSAIRHEQQVLMFSLEMSADSILQRLLTMESRIKGVRVRRGNFSDKDRRQFDEARERLAGWPLLLDDTPGLRMDYLASRARRAVHEHGEIGMVIVDYLQLIKGTNTESRVQEVSSISRDLKSLARELNVPVIALSQLSRAPDKDGRGGGGRAPRMSDLRDSGTIEQDADLIIFLHRAQTTSEAEDDPLQESLLKVIVEKHRNGPVGYTELQFLREYVSFRNRERDEH